MKNVFKVFVAAALLVFGALPVSAADFVSNEKQVIIGESQTYQGDLYVASGEVLVGGTVDGSLFVAGGTVRVTGEVKGDLFAFGGQVNVTGDVAGSVRTGGGTVVVDGNVGKDVLVGGGSAEIGSKAKVDGDTYVGAGSLIIAGETGNVKAGTENLTVYPGANVKGNLEYYSQNKAVVNSEAKIAGETVFHEQVIKKNQHKKSAIGFVNFLALVSTIIFALLLVYFFPRVSAGVANSWQNRFWWNMLWGFVYVIAAPVVIIMLFITIFGAPAALVLLPIYFISFYLAKLFGTIAFGAWVYRTILKKTGEKLGWKEVFIGAVLLEIIGIIPVFGWIVGYIVSLVALGVMVSSSKRARGRVEA